MKTAKSKPAPRRAYTSGGVNRRSYKQYCALAHTLDLVGERWTLLLLRPLIAGSMRFKDLLEDHPGIGTNLLAARLKRLEREGIVRRVKLPPPAGSTVYELTERGRALEPAMVALTKWGRRSLGLPRRGMLYRPSWSVLAMKSTFRPEAAQGVRETYEYRIDDEVFHVRVEDGTMEAAQGPGWRPAFVFTSDTQTFLRVGTGQLNSEEAIRTGALKLGGSTEALQRSFEIFGAAPEEAKEALKVAAGKRKESR